MLTMYNIFNSFIGSYSYFYKSSVFPCDFTEESGSNKLAVLHIASIDSLEKVFRFLKLVRVYNVFAGFFFFK